MHELDGAVSALMASVADTVVMPRFRNLFAHEVSEKSVGELVTVADQESEHALHEGLLAIDNTARVVGEEACERDPHLLHGLERGRVWVIDPIDGTANFAAGHEPFGLMVSLLEEGEALAGWMYDPVRHRFCHAAAGMGAFVNGEPVRVRDVRRARPVAALATQFMAPAVRERVRARGEAAFELVPIPRCAAEHYPRVRQGENDVALFQRTLPWDHLAGALFLNEAGGRAARWDGSPYRAGDGGTGILAAATPELWNRAAAALGCGDPGFLAE